MNFLFFTPVNVASAIARVSCLITHELLAQGHRVVVVGTEQTQSTLWSERDFETEIVPWSDKERILSEASQPHIAVYQVGNSYEFHYGAIEWLDRLPGIVCLHDFYIAHLFYGWAAEHRDEARDVLRRWYGDAVASRFFELAKRPDFIEQTADTAPLTEWIASKALAVITHSKWGSPRVQSACIGPVHVAPLPYSTTADTVTDTNAEKNENRLTLLTVGHINSNKRAVSVIRAIGRSPSLRRKTTYRLVGPVGVDTILELSSLANALGVRLMISGAVDDETLALAFAQADIVSCLRWPSLEAASASAIEAMLWGKPIMVTDTGFYKEIPDSFVAKISPENEIPDICAALERLDTSPSERSQMGERAWQWATQTYSAESYARRLVDVASNLHEERPVATARSYFVKTLAEWKGDPDRYLPDRTLGLPTRAT